MITKYPRRSDAHRLLCCSVSVAFIDKYLYHNCNSRVKSFQGYAVQSYAFARESSGSVQGYAFTRDHFSRLKA